MYRWLLCFRYLRTRYIALASIISVTLGVATLIVVNSVMAGFSAEMHERLHGLASDILIECHTSGGMPNPEAHLAEINKVCGDEIVGSSVSVHVPGMLGIEFNGQLITRHVNLVGIDPKTYDKSATLVATCCIPTIKLKSASICATTVTLRIASSFHPRVGIIVANAFNTNKNLAIERARFEALQRPSRKERTRRSDRSHDGLLGAERTAGRNGWRIGNRIRSSHGAIPRHHPRDLDLQHQAA